ncbi:hypothetical protein CR513_16776, partial [Mucuna pruriens]
METRPKEARPTSAMIVAAKIMLGEGYKPGQGLCKDSTGITKPIFDLEPFVELKRLVEQEDKMIQPHKEGVEIINLECKEERKEVKIDTTI